VDCNNNNNNNNNGQGRLLKTCEVCGAGNKSDFIWLAFLPHIGVTVKNPLTEIKREDRREIK
jgi:hypothetical protein